jgi:hypothetical protein
MLIDHQLKPHHRHQANCLRIIAAEWRCQHQHFIKLSDDIMPSQAFALRRPNRRHFANPGMLRLQPDDGGFRGWAGDVQGGGYGSAALRLHFLPFQYLFALSCCCRCRSSISHQHMPAGDGICQAMVDCRSCKIADVPKHSEAQKLLQHGAGSG